jgi:uncharacterized protein
MKLVGRDNEIKELNKCLHSDRSHFIAIYGRRRVGKTFLVKTFFKNSFAFYATGLADADKQTQLSNFNLALKKYKKKGTPPLSNANDWLNAFNNLIEVLEQQDQGTKKVVFLDELPWMETRNSGFLTALEFFWNSWASSREDILLIICGSASWWIIDKIINNKRGLYNRVTNRIKIEPFTLKGVKEFMVSRGGNYDHYQLIQLYMVFGGVPFYLDNIDVQESASMNIDRLCFGQKATMKSEYNQLFASLFNSPERHIAVIEALTNKKVGFYRDELLKQSGLTDGGRFSMVLEELEQCNFIRKYYKIGNKKRDAIYQLVDNYTLFYHKFIKQSNELDDELWLNMLNTPEYFSWAGNAFEIICLQHAQEIKNGLGISGVQSKIYSWANPSTQIDMVIDRKDQVINLIEAKFSIDSYTITKSYSDNLRKKVAEFIDETKTKKSVWLVMVSVFGLDNSPYNNLVQKDLTMNIFF